MTKKLQLIVLIIAVIGGLAGSFHYLERYQTVKAADEMKKNIEEQSVKTFEVQQKVLDVKLKSSELKYEVDKLEFLKTQRVLLEKQYSETPTDLLKEKLDSVIIKIEKLETKLLEE